ncbi:Hsp20/alpha crystallin family protein [Ferruginibacter sp.]|uniref:Hsp20/alpha crystallin family protein n=2 Tax=Ferruginibacter sp. TaxID=1940288 RepID=UPI00265AB2C1|nr:Hsp20/alpha crystallin family protein [Ferruginibacter sp.]
MKNSISTQPCHSIYPGQFVPLHNEVEIKEELKRSFAESSVTQPPVTLTESEHSVKVEIALPGVTREELLIYTDKNILSVCVAHHPAAIPEQGTYKLHEFTNNYFYRHIALPANVDAEFISAEYKSGILSLHVPKTKEPVKQQHTRIAVY